MCGYRSGRLSLRWSGGTRPWARLKRVAVFRFLSEDWSPWIALVRMRERWPELRFYMRAGYSTNLQRVSLAQLVYEL